MSSNTQNFRVKYGLDVTEDANIGANLYVTDSAIFSNDVEVQGNLTVTGNTQFVTSTALAFGAGDIIFFSGANGTPTTNATFTVNRGSSANVAILWNEDADLWEFTNDGTVYTPLRRYSDLTYVFDTLNSTNVDPGLGKIRLDNGTPSSVTQISVSTNEHTGADVASFIDTFDDSTNDVKGFLIFRSYTSPNNSIIFQVNTVTTQSGYRQLDVDHISGGSIPTNGEIVSIEFARAGDKGPQGDQGSQGVQGAQGAQGQQGNQGEGPQGDQGVPGFQGDQGHQGRQGAQGNQGNQGDQGAQGIRGFQGDQGVEGTSGLVSGSNSNCNSLAVGTSTFTTAGEIRAAGNIIGFFTSDASLKDNITPIENALEKIDNIRGVRFDWTDDAIMSRGGVDNYFVRKSDVGVIAQEIESVLPEAVATRIDGTKAVRYELIIPLLLQAIKELKHKIK